MKKYVFLSFVFFVLIILTSCSSGSTDVSDIAGALSDRLVDALDIEGGEVKTGDAPKGNDSKEAPQLDVVTVNELKLGATFAFRLESKHEKPEEVKKAIIKIEGAKEYIEVKATLINGVMEIFGVLKGDEKLQGADFKTFFALQNKDGLTGKYKPVSLNIKDEKPQQTTNKVQSFLSTASEDTKEDGRPEGCVEDDCPQISEVGGDSELYAGDKFRVLLKSEFQGSGKITSILISVPGSTAYSEVAAVLADNAFVFEGNLSDDVKIGDVVTFIFALKTDVGKVGVFKNWVLKIVEKKENDCKDKDGDGYGLHCEKGFDCNDDDSNLYQYLSGYLDEDKDEYGLGDQLQVCSGEKLKEGYADNPDDCDDTSKDLYKYEKGFVDNDKDGFGFGTDSEDVCSGELLPEGYSENNLDCDDDNKDRNPGLKEIYYNGIDDDCDDKTVDDDQDNDDIKSDMATGGTPDCDDTDSKAFKTVEAFVDNDKDAVGVGEAVTICTDGTLPEGYAGITGDCDDENTDLFQNIECYEDKDGDKVGFGDKVDLCTNGTLPPTHVTKGGDCNDENGSLYQNIKGYKDSDKDGYGKGASSNVCSGDSLPEGYSTNDTDCDDTNKLKHANLTVYVDEDKDGYGTGSSIELCHETDTPPEGYSLVDTDCAPQDSNKYDAVTLYDDLDEDGYGTTANPEMQCIGDTPPTGKSKTSDDCDDTTKGKSPGNQEIYWNDKDDNCDGNFGNDLMFMHGSHVGGVTEQIAHNNGYVYAAHSRTLTVYQASGTVLNKVNAINFDNEITELYARDDKLHMLMGTHYVVINILNPLQLGNPYYMSLSGIKNGLCAKGTKAYLAAGTSGILEIDVSNPATGLSGKYINLSKDVYHISLVERSDKDYLAVYTASYAGVGYDLSFIAIDTLNAPQLYEVYGPNVPNDLTCTHWYNDLFMVGSNYSIAHFSVYNTTDLGGQTPFALEGTITLPVSYLGYPQGVYNKDNYAYVTTNNTDGLSIISIDDINGTHTNYAIGAPAHDIVVSGDYAYAAVNYEGLAAFDVTTPNAPTDLKKFYSPAKVNSIYADGNMVYATDSDLGLVIIRTDGQGHPTSTIVNKKLMMEAIDVHISNGYAYVMTSENGLKIIDVRDADNPGDPATLNYDSNNFGVAVQVIDNTLYFATLEAIARGVGSLKVYDVTDPTNPVESASITLNHRPVDLFVKDDIAYIADDYGVSTVSVKKPITDTPTERIDLGDSSAKSIYVAYDHLYIVTNLDIQIYNMSDLTNPNYASEISIQDMDKVFVYSNYLFAYGEGSLNIVDIINNESPEKKKTLNIIPEANRSMTDIYVADDVVYIADFENGVEFFKLSTDPDEYPCSGTCDPNTYKQTCTNGPGICKCNSQNNQLEYTDCQEYCEGEGHQGAFQCVEAVEGGAMATDASCQCMTVDCQHDSDCVQGKLCFDFDPSKMCVTKCDVALCDGDISCVDIGRPNGCGVCLGQYQSGFPASSCDPGYYKTDMCLEGSIETCVKECDAIKNTCESGNLCLAGNSVDDPNTIVGYCEPFGGQVKQDCPACVKTTWYDSKTDLEWQITPSTTEFYFSEAEAQCDVLSLDGKSDWRLPVIDELRSIVRNCTETEVGGDCKVTGTCLDSSMCYDAKCNGCGARGYFFESSLEGNTGYYWSSSVDNDTTYKWVINYAEASIETRSAMDSSITRCVRGGPDIEVETETDSSDGDIDLQ